MIQELIPGGINAPKFKYNSIFIKNVCFRLEANFQKSNNTFHIKYYMKSENKPIDSL